MKIHAFNEQALIRDLDRVPRRLRVLFAAAAAERLMPAYVRFTNRTGRGDPATLASILGRLWANAQSETLDSRQVQKDADLSMSLLPIDSAATWVPEQAWAEDAVAALAYALHCQLSGLSQDAAWSARRAYEAVDNFVVAQQETAPNSAQAEEQILAHPLIQRELSRQQRDLEELLTATARNLISISQQIHQRAQAESKSVFQDAAEH